jgi:hypothetical protein
VKKQIILNCTPQETRVAILEGGRLAEIYIERLREQGIVGNIYKGRVQRVLPGMQAAFVDIGFEKAAFLHASDFRHELEELPQILHEDGDLDGALDGSDDGADVPEPAAADDFSISPLAEDEEEHGLTSVISEPVPHCAGRSRCPGVCDGVRLVAVPETTVAS